MRRKISLDEYKSLLENHDWYYQMTDDFKVWQKGNEQDKILKEISTYSVEYNEVYNTYFKQKRKDLCN